MLDILPPQEIRKILARSKPTVVHKPAMETGVTAGEELSCFALERFDPASESRASRRLCILLLLAKVNRQGAMQVKHIAEEINKRLPLNHAVEVETIRADLIQLQKEGRINALCERGIRGWIAWGKYA